MSYSTVFELRAAVSPSGGSDNPPTPATNTAADLPNAVLLDAIAEADSTIDSAIGGRYIVPVATVVDLDTGDAATPHPIDFWSRNIAAYNATLTQRGSLDFTDNDPIARRYNATMAALDAVRDGKAALGIPELGSSDSGGTSQEEGAAAPYNQYGGDNMMQPDDFGLFPGGIGWQPGVIFRTPYGW